MPHIEFDYFNEHNGENYETLSSQEEKDKTAVSSIIEKLLKEIAYGHHTGVGFVKGPAYGRNDENKDILNQAISLYAECFSEKYLFGHQVTTDKDDMQSALDCIESYGIKINEHDLQMKISFEYQAISYYMQHTMQKPTHTLEHIEKLKALRSQLSSAINEIDAVVGKNGQVQQNISTHEKQADEITQSRKFAGPTL